jgi:large subunit ribosomal protein L1
MAKQSKRVREAAKLIDNKKVYSLKEAFEVMDKYSARFKTKFDESVELVIKLGVDPRHSDQMIRGAVAMPKGLGKKVRVAVFCKPEREEEAKAAGADIVGAAVIEEKVLAGKFDFDVCIATPDMMAAVGKLGKLLGPKGLMPNPKLGTVSPDIKGAVKNVKSGQVEYRTEKAGIIHAGVGKLSFSSENLTENIKALYEAVLAAKPAGLKGNYMKGAYLSVSMGPSIRLDINSIVG